MHSEAGYLDILVCTTIFRLSGACCIQWLISRVLHHRYMSTAGHTPSNFFILCMRVISGCEWHCLVSWVWFQPHCFSMRVGTWQLHIDIATVCWNTSNFCQMEMQIHLFTHVCSEDNRTLSVHGVVADAVGINMYSYSTVAMSLSYWVTDI